MSGPRLTAEESGLVQLAAHGHQMALVNLAVLEGPPPPLDEVRARVLTLLPRFPRYEAIPVPVPFDLQRPVWARSSGFDVADHVTAARIDRQPCGGSYTTGPGHGRRRGRHRPATGNHHITAARGPLGQRP